MKNVHMIGNAHLDPVWLWDYREGFGEIKATFQSALDRLEEDPDFIFTSSSAAYYEWVEQNNPEMFKKIKERVAEGRWKLMGGMWIQPDCNLPSGESFIRQGLIGQNYFKEKFGQICTVGYNVDSFGHNIILPQILNKLGMNSYVFMRPMPNEKRLPNHIFNFTSRDGSSVKTFRILYEYLSTSEDIEFHINRCFDQVGDNQSIMCFYGVGNHGGGPTKANLRTIHRLQESNDTMNVIFSNPERFFEECTDPDSFSVMDELQHHAVGCYSALSEVKKQNKKSEIKLFQTEALASIVAKLDPSFLYESASLKQAWKNVLFNQFHDILPGTSIPSAYDYVNDQYGEANSIAERLMNQALQRLTWGVNIEMQEGNTPFVAINLNQFSGKQIVEAEVPLKYGNYILKDYTGKEIPMQIIRSEALVDRRIHPRGRIIFSDDIPAFGYKLYYLEPIGSSEEIQKNMDDNEENEEVWYEEDYSLENQYLKVIFNEDSGAIEALIDKATGINLVENPGISLKIFKDTTDTWSHGTNILGGRERALKLIDMKYSEIGEVKNSVTIYYEINKSILKLEYSLYKDSPYLKGKLDYLYSEPQTIVRLDVPVNVNFMKITADMSFGTIERETNGVESFFHKYVDLEGLHKDSLGTTGVSVISDSRYSYCAKGNRLSIMLLRNAFYANHEPMTVENGLFSGLDEGKGTTEFVIYPHAKEFIKSDTLKIATQFLKPAFVQIETFHKGEYLPENSFISVNDERVDISAIKISEDNQAQIIRIAECQGLAKELQIQWFTQTHVIKIAPFEVKTIRIDIQTNTFTEVDFLEETQHESI